MTEDGSYVLEDGMPYSYMFTENDRLQWEARVIKAFGCISVSLDPSRSFYRTLEENARDINTIMRNMAEANKAKAVEVNVSGADRNRFLDAMKKYSTSGGFRYEIEYGSPLRIVSLQ